MLTSLEFTIVFRFYKGTAMMPRSIERIYTYFTVEPCYVFQKFRLQRNLLHFMVLDHSINFDYVKGDEVLVRQRSPIVNMIG